MDDATASFDLDAYLGRIGYHGPLAPTLTTLRSLHVLHPDAIPFEDISIFMGDPVPLDLAAIQAKLVHGGRGGYCYEQNALLRAALEALGFKVTGLAARVMWGAPQTAPPRPRTHMLLLVSLDQARYVVDVGFGGVVLTAPLLLDTDAGQETPHERFRILARADGEFVLEAELEPGWRPLYRFGLEPQLPVDYEPLNWFDATYPLSPFRTNLMAARSGPYGRKTLANTRLKIRAPGKPLVERTLDSLEALRSALVEEFGLTLPDGFDGVRGKLGL